MHIFRFPELHDFGARGNLDGQPACSQPNISICIICHALPRVLQAFAVQAGARLQHWVNFCSGCLAGLIRPSPITDRRKGAMLSLLLHICACPCEKGRGLLGESTASR